MVLIKSVKVIDGTGRPPFKADVLLKGGRVAAVGSFPRKQAETVINGIGHYLTPGFIDVNTSSDHYLNLFDYPEQGDFLSQGVTTIMGGNCGSSLAPLLYGSLESIQKWSDPNKANVDWRTVEEFLSTIDRLKLGVNFGTLVGHSTIRRALIGEEIRKLAAKEIQVFQNILQRSLTEGAFGISTGLGYAHARKTPYEELRSLLRTVAAKNGAHTAHLKDEQNELIDSVKEILSLREESGVKTIINHLRPIKHGNVEDFHKAVEMLEGAGVYFNSYPFDSSLVPIYTLLPGWAQNGGRQIMLENLATKSITENILKDLPPFGPDDIIVSSATGNEYLVGKTIGEFAENRGLPLAKALLLLMEISGLKAVVIYKNVDESLAAESLFHPNALISTNSSSFSPEENVHKPERSYRTFTKFLELARERQIIPLEKAIQKITSLPAKIFNLSERGEIREGNFADLVLLKDSWVAATFVNGQLAFENGKLKNARAGQVLRHL